MLWREEQWSATGNSTTNNWNMSVYWGALTRQIGRIEIGKLHASEETKDAHTNAKHNSLAPATHLGKKRR
jgi:hypothetical protein